MKVAFCIRPEYSTLLGGDVVQMLKTKSFLEQNHNVKIDIVTSPDLITNEFDIIHVFNFSTYKISKRFIQKANELNIPVVSSPIFWDYSYASTEKLFYLIPGRNYLSEQLVNALKTLSRIVAQCIGKPEVISPEFRRNAKWMFEHSKFIAPNSSEEADLFLSWIKSNDVDKVRVVYNATEKSEDQVNIESDVFHKKYNIPRDYILQVGRIEYCKNQLNLLYSLREERDIPIVFVGKITDPRYFNKLKQIADKRGNVYFIDAVPHSEVGMFYKYARLHVLMSLRESPGLVNIEALANDCPIVISDKRFLPVDTYFQNQPYVADPLDVKEIRTVVLSAYKERKIEGFDFEKFSWRNVAYQTFGIYEEIISQKKV